MKKLSNFREKVIKKTQSSQIFGCNTVETRSSEYIQDGDCCLLKLCTDSFEDCDNNGKWDDGESGESTCYSLDVTEIGGC